MYYRHNSQCHILEDKSFISTTVYIFTFVSATVCNFVTLCLLFFYLCFAVLHILVAGLLARSPYLEGPANGHLGTGFSWFSCVY